MNAPAPGRLLSNAEAAALLGLTPRQLEKRRNRGGDVPPNTYVGRSPRYSIKHINEYLIRKGRNPHRGN